MVENKQKERGLSNDFFRQSYSTDFGRDECRIHVRYKDEIENCLRDGRTAYIAEPVEVGRSNGLDGILDKKYINKKEYNKSKDIGYIQQAEAIHRARLNGYNQKEIAAYLGVSASTVREREKEFFSLDEVKKAKQEKYIKESEDVYELRKGGLSQKETAMKLGISDSAVRRRERLHSKILEEEKFNYFTDSASFDKEPVIGDLLYTGYSNLENITEDAFRNASSGEYFLSEVFRNAISNFYTNEISRNTVFDKTDKDIFKESIERAVSCEESFLDKIRRFLLNEEADAKSYEQAKIDFGLVAAGILNRLVKGVSCSKVVNEYIRKKYMAAGEACRITSQEIWDIYNLQEKIWRKRIKGWQDLEKKFISYRTHIERKSLLDDLEKKVDEENESEIQKPVLVDIPKRNLVDKIFYGAIYAASILLIMGSFLRINNAIKKSVLNNEEKPEEIHLQLTTDQIRELNKDPYENERLALRAWAMEQQRERVFTQLDRVKEAVGSSISIAAEFGDYFLKS